VTDDTLQQRKQFTDPKVCLFVSSIAEHTTRVGYTLCRSLRELCCI